jgi:hypothetical protein
MTAFIFGSALEVTAGLVGSLALFFAMALSSIRGAH